MSHSYEHAFDAGAVAADAVAAERAAFIRRTYSHLAGAIGVFIGLEFALLQLPGIEQVVRGMAGSRAIWIVILLGFIGVSWLANYWAHSGASPAMQYAGLGLYVVAEAVIFLPLLYIAKNFYPQAIPTAALLTLMIFFALSIVVFTTRKDFSFLGPILMVAGLLFLGVCIIGVFFGSTLGLSGLVICFVGAALACGYILYDTSNVLHHYRTDQHVAAALALFASVALLFWYILRILMMRRD
jgi:FtsH-binding integral membrane protein